MRVAGGSHLEKHCSKSSLVHRLCVGSGHLSCDLKGGEWRTDWRAEAAGGGVGQCGWGAWATKIAIAPRNTNMSNYCSVSFSLCLMR